MFRFIHSSDLHIAKRFGNMPEDLRGRLREARHGSIERLANHARAHGATTVLLAGDTFDTETPTPAVLRQALAAMGVYGDLRWVILPGNHDSLQAEQLWTTACNAAPANVILALEPTAIAIETGVVLLPAPCTTRRPGRDLSAWMEECHTGDEVIRIGVAHGPKQNFSEDSGASDIIAPDRPPRARLDYLPLGDWHGPMRVNERTWYSGTCEPDRFKHSKPGEALLVAIAGPGALPDVRSIRTGSFEWRMLDLHMLSADDAAERLAAALPDGGMRRQILLHIAASGQIRLAGRSALAAAVAAVEPEFAYLDLDEAALATDCEIADLDLIDRGGALRQAAEALLRESADETRAAEDRTLAREALVRLFSYCGTTRP